MRLSRCLGGLAAAVAVVAGTVAVGTAAGAASARMAFGRHGDIFVRESDGAVRAMTDFPHENTRAIAWAPDGTRIAGIVDDGGDESIIVFAADRPAPVREFDVLVRGLPGESFGFVQWSPDGAQLVFDVEVENTRHIEIVSIAAPVRRVVPGTSGTSSPTFTPDGERLLFVQGERTAELATARLDGTDRRRILADAGLPSSMFEPTFSPDGRLLAIYSFFGTRGSDIFVVPVDGSAPARALGLQSREGECSGPGMGSWLSDSAHLALAMAHCSASRLPDRIVQVGIDDRSFLDVPVGAPGEAPGSPEVHGSGLLVPIPRAVTPTTRPRATTSTTAIDATSTAETSTTTSGNDGTVALAQEDSRGGATGWLVAGSVAAVAAGALWWFRRRAAPL